MKFVKVVRGMTYIELENNINIILDELERLSSELVDIKYCDTVDRCSALMILNKLPPLVVPEEP